MTEYALAPNRKWDPTSPYRSPRVMLEQGQLRAYRVRGNGTMRHLELYPLGSTLREAAEWISDQVDIDGRTVQAVARELNVSVPTIRRYLEGLTLTEEIEEGDWDDLHFDSAGEPIWEMNWVEEEVPADDPEGNPGEVTAATPNTLPTPQRNQAQVEKDAALLARNRARATSTPQPTDEERAAVLAATQAEQAAREAQVPGAQCEPVGTTADELEPALAASVAQARGEALAMCFCGDQGAHAPGVTGCKNQPVARRPRSHG